jgi:hypothetical protein
MSDSILDLGHGRFGVLQTARTPRAVMLVLLNAGAVHRQGPFRLYVHLARRLAALGFSSLRFDQPGIGDSLQAAERPLREIVGEVLDQLQAQTGCERFVIGGICSAADAGWQQALSRSADQSACCCWIRWPTARAGSGSADCCACARCRPCSPR